MEENGQDPQMRPTSLPEKLSGPCSSMADNALESHYLSDLPVDETDAAGGDASGLNGTSSTTPEEVPGKLDLKFHHTHLW